MKSLELDQEYVPPGEEEAIQRVLDMMRRGFEREYPAGTRPALRSVHPKSHGTVRAELIVEDRLPDELRRGVFKEPRSYPAYVRFSSTSPRVQSDKVRDFRGVAIKLMDVPGEKVLDDEKDATTQDFLMASTNVFFARDVADYVDFVAATLAGRPLSFFFGLNPFKWRLRELMGFVRSSLGTVTHPLCAQYWSQSACRLGERAMKYSIAPSKGVPAPVHVKPGDRSLGEALERQLALGPWSFDFLVQLQAHPTKTPIEDLVTPWSESVSPFRKVATLQIPMQSFTSAAQVELAEGMSFTPWHCLPEHRPLGGLNRARRAVYQMISTLRHERNGAPRKEPRASPTWRPATGPG